MHGDNFWGKSMIKVSAADQMLDPGSGDEASDRRCGEDASIHRASMQRRHKQYKC